MLGVVGAVVEARPLLLDAAVAELPAALTNVGGNACGLCLGVVDGEGDLDVGFGFIRGSPERKPELEPELIGWRRAGREGTLAFAPRLTAQEDGVEGADEASRTAAEKEDEEWPNEPMIRVFTGMRV